MTTDARPYLGGRPIWFLNMCANGWSLEDPSRYLTSLCVWAPCVNRFIDGTMVKGDRNAQAVVDLVYRLYLRFGDFWWMQMEPGDGGAIRLLCATFKRLDGLTTRPRPPRDMVV